MKTALRISEITSQTSAEKFKVCQSSRLSQAQRSGFRLVASQLVTEQKQLSIELQSIQSLREFVQHVAISRSLDHDEIALLELAATEVFTNIVRHAVSQSKIQKTQAPFVTLRACSTRSGLTLKMIYKGAAFKPKQQASLPKIINEDEMPEGGFGLYIIESACDQVDYLHQNGVNTICLTKRRAVQQIPLRMVAV